MTTMGVQTGIIITSGVMAEVAIFADASYLYLALVGAMVSVFGVAHEVFGAQGRYYSTKGALMELLKGIVLGVLAMPFWFIMLTSIGPSILKNYMELIPNPSTFSSISLIISFCLAWFTVPIVDFAAMTVSRLIGGLITRLARRDR